jgi:nitroreductase
MTMTTDEKLGFIFGRRSIRAYTRDPVGDEAVQKLLEAAMGAPSAAACDPWRFIVVRNRHNSEKSCAPENPTNNALPMNGEQRRYHYVESECNFELV